MRTRFLGSLTNVPVSAEEICHEGLATARFPGGFVAHDPALDLSTDADELCLAIGEPVFRHSELAALAATHGDAAAWLAAFRRFGAEAPKQVGGRFSAVFVRSSARTVMIVTDRFGTRSICYAESPTGLSFAERADAVPGADLRIAPQSIFDYLYFHAIPAPSTIYAGVKRLPAGHMLEWRQGQANVAPYWTPRPGQERLPDLAECKDRLVGLVERAVLRECTRANMGAYLSGGTDSSTVAGMLTRISGAPAKTYSIGFDAAGYDEMEYARIAARHFGTDHHEHYVTPDDLLEGIPAIASHYEQPFGNSSAVPNWICARRAREDGVEKMLAGDGGDELFGGNVRYAKQRVFDWYDRVPGLARKRLLEPLLSVSAMGRIPVAKKGLSYVAQARVPMPDRLQTYNLLVRIGISSVFEPAFLAAIDSEEPIAAQRDCWRGIQAESLVDRMLVFDWKYTLADNDLPKVIESARLVGMRVGFPLLDDELVDFSLSLPPEWKVRGLKLRWFFKEALRGFLPEEIIRKQKHGFGLPFGVWACEHAGLKSVAEDALHNLESRGVVRPAFIERLLREHLPAYPGYYGEMVWILMILELWMQTYAPDWRFEPS